MLQAIILKSFFFYFYAQNYRGNARNLTSFARSSSCDEDHGREWDGKDGDRAKNKESQQNNIKKKCMYMYIYIFVCMNVWIREKRQRRE